MSARKEFKYRDDVIVKVHGRRAFAGWVYSEYKQPGEMRRICVQLPNGCGVGYPVKFVSHARSPQSATRGRRR